MHWHTRCTNIGCCRCEWSQLVNRWIYVQIGICLCPNLLALISFDFKFYGLFLWWVTRTTITSHIVDNSVYGSIWYIAGEAKLASEYHVFFPPAQGHVERCVMAWYRFEDALNCPSHLTPVLLEKSNVVGTGPPLGSVISYRCHPSEMIARTVSMPSVGDVILAVVRQRMGWFWAVAAMPNIVMTISAVSNRVAFIFEVSLIMV